MDDLNWSRIIATVTAFVVLVCIVVGMTCLFIAGDADNRILEPHDDASPEY